MRALKDEQSRLAAWKHELEVLEEKTKTDSEALDRQRRQLNTDRQKLDQVAAQVRDKSAEINNLVEVGCWFHALWWFFVKVGYFCCFWMSNTTNANAVDSVCTSWRSRCFLWLRI